MDKRRFENTGGTSNKFWEVWTNGNTMHCQWGRIGTAGQSKCWTYLSSASARATALRRANEKLRKGYSEVIDAEDGTVLVQRYVSSTPGVPTLIDDGARVVVTKDTSGWKTKGKAGQLTSVKPRGNHREVIFDEEIESTFKAPPTRIIVVPVSAMVRLQTNPPSPIQKQPKAKAKVKQAEKPTLRPRGKPIVKLDDD